MWAKVGPALRMVLREARRDLREPVELATSQGQGAGLGQRVAAASVKRQPLPSRFPSP
jgi:hypothetical protein